MTTVNIYPGNALQQQQGVQSYTDLLCSQANLISSSYDNDFSSLLSYDGDGTSGVASNIQPTNSMAESSSLVSSIPPVAASMTTSTNIPSSASGSILEAPFSPITPIMHPLYFQQQQQQSTQPQECNTSFVGTYGNIYMSQASLGPYVLNGYGAQDNTTAAMHQQQQQSSGDLHQSLYSSSSAPPSLMPMPFKHVEHTYQQQHTIDNSTIAVSTTNNNDKKSITPPTTTTTQPRSRGRRVSSVPTQGERMFVCQTEGCGKVFKRSEHLKRHTRSIHTLEKPFECPYQNCHKRFSRSDNLNQHIRIHRHNHASIKKEKKPAPTTTQSSSTPSLDSYHFPSSNFCTV
ncbi:hypothetical protein K492DRAFT_189278 [Lichtheimia hyalospora FSU 10163]|nr:hypothetical protein K492DRAFT_189278 [Lichtheimia hyalospora FSU 10163]